MTLKLIVLFLSSQEWNKKARENPVKENVCKCGKIFKREKDLKFHSKYCGDSACKECGKVFKNAILLQKHVKVHFPDITNTCTICNKVFRSKQALRRPEVVCDAAKKIACRFVALIDIIKIFTSKKKNLL